MTISHKSFTIDQIGSIGSDLNIEDSVQATWIATGNKDLAFESAKEGIEI